MTSSSIRLFYKAFLTSFLLLASVQTLTAEDLSEKVSKDLDSATIGAHQFEISNWKGDVTIEGQVSSDSDKQIVLQKIKSVDGVDLVIDKLQVTNSGSSKNSGIDQAINFERVRKVQKATENYLASIKLKGPHSLQYLTTDTGVIVQGELPAGAEKQALHSYWKQELTIPVEDQIKVRAWPTDSDLKAKIISELSTKLGLDLRGINFIVNSGVVTLTGSRTNHFEADQLSTAIWMIEGVKDIKSEVTFGGSRDDPMSKMYKTN